MSAEPPQPERGATLTHADHEEARATPGDQEPWASGDWAPRGEGKERATPAALTQPGDGARFLLETLSCHQRLQREGRLSHHHQGWGCPPLCPLQPHPGPPPPGPAANCPPSSPVAQLATGKEGGRRVGLELTSQGQEKGEGLVRKPQEGCRGVGGGRTG